MIVNQCEVNYYCNLSKMRQCKYYKRNENKSEGINCLYLYGLYCSYFPAQFEAFKEEQEEIEFALNQPN